MPKYDFNVLMFRELRCKYVKYLLNVICSRARALVSMWHVLHLALVNTLPTTSTVCDASCYVMNRDFNKR